MLLTYVKLSKARDSARSDDSNKLEEHISKLLTRDVTGGQDITILLENKKMRGFNHLVTGRLLIPAQMLDKFDENPLE